MHKAKTGKGMLGRGLEAKIPTQRASLAVLPEIILFPRQQEIKQCFCIRSHHGCVSMCMVLFGLEIKSYFLEQVGVS